MYAIVIGSDPKTERLLCYGLGGRFRTAGREEKGWHTWRVLVASEEPDADLAKGPIKTRVPGVGRRRSPQSSPLERRPRDIEGEFL